MIDSQLDATRLVGYNHLISNKPEWNNCFIKNNHQISLKSCHVLFRKILSWTAKRFSSAAIVSLCGKKFQNFSCCADAYTYHICRAWYNDSYTMATKPIKFLELHYTMTQFLIMKDIVVPRRWGNETLKFDMNKLIKVEIPPWRDNEGDVSTFSPFSERTVRRSSFALTKG